MSAATRDDCSSVWRAFGTNPVTLRNRGVCKPCKPNKKRRGRAWQQSPERAAQLGKQSQQPLEPQARSISRNGREECKFATSRSHQQRPPTRWRKLTQCAPNGGQHDCLRSQPYRPASSQRRFMVRWDMANVEIWNLNLESMALTADRKPLTQ